MNNKKYIDENILLKHKNFNISFALVCVEYYIINNNYNFEEILENTFLNIIEDTNEITLKNINKCKGSNYNIINISSKELFLKCIENEFLMKNSSFIKSESYSIKNINCNEQNTKKNNFYYDIYNNIIVRPINNIIVDPLKNVYGYMSNTFCHNDQKNELEIENLCNIDLDDIFYDTFDTYSTNLNIEYDNNFIYYLLLSDGINYYILAIDKDIFTLSSLHLEPLCIYDKNILWNMLTNNMDIKKLDCIIFSKNIV